MPSGEHLLAGALVTFTLGATLFFGVRQLRLLLKTPTTEEHHVLRRSAMRRLVVSVLLAACAILIAVPYFTGLADEVARIGLDRGLGVPPRDMTEDELHVARTYLAFWIAVAALIMTAVTIIAIDMVVIRRYWAASYQRLKDDRSAMMARQLDRLRAERGYFDNSN
jgi:NADH:ubiquinone oxidoreductase subunit 5 (subunit L)/multisubunit Na+/H+ antiporter MnhA subunit